MKCRFCGQDIRSSGEKLISSYGAVCKASQTGKHVALSDGSVCVYCGEKPRIIAGKLITSYGERCKASPTGKHALQ